MEKRQDKMEQVEAGVSAFMTRLSQEKIQRMVAFLTELKTKADKFANIGIHEIMTRHDVSLYTSPALQEAGILIKSGSKLYKWNCEGCEITPRLARNVWKGAIRRQLALKCEREEKKRLKKQPQTSLELTEKTEDSDLNILIDELQDLKAKEEALKKKISASKLKQEIAATRKRLAELEQIANQ